MLDRQPMDEGGDTQALSRRRIGTALAALAVAAGVVAALLWQLLSMTVEMRPSPLTEAAVLRELSPPPPRSSGAAARAQAPTYVLVMGADDAGDASLRTLLLVRLVAGEPASVLWIPPKAGITEEGGRSVADAYGRGGPARAIRCVKGLTGLPVHHYVDFRVSGLARVVDAMGGVWVDPGLVAEESPDLTGAPLAARGSLRLSGDEVLAIARGRREEGATRTAPAGLLVVNAALAQAKEKLRSPAAFSLLLAAAESVETDMGTGELLGLGERMRGAATTRTRQSWLTGPESGGRILLSRDHERVRREVSGFAE